MELNKLLKTFDREFQVNKVIDNWEFAINSLFLNYVEKSFMIGTQTGLVIRNGEEINRIYTAFSPSVFVLNQIKKKGIKGSLLIVKHPFDWDGSKTGTGFISFTQKEYDLMKEMQISIYSLHTPMDKNRNDDIVSTAYGFAKVIGLKVEKEFASEGERNPSILLGLIGRVKETNYDELVNRISKQLNYKVKTLKLNNGSITKVAIVTGGGFVPEIIEEAKKLGVNTYITGVMSQNASEYSKNNFPIEFNAVKNIGVNIIGCSHYLTEKWAMEFSIPYFSKYCESEFIEDLDAYTKLE